MDLQLQQQLQQQQLQQTDDVKPHAVNGFEHDQGFSTASDTFPEIPFATHPLDELFQNIY